MGFLSRRRDDREQNPQNYASESNITNTPPVSNESEAIHRALHTYNDRDQLQNRALTFANKPAATQALRGILRQKRDNNRRPPRHYHVTFTDNVYKIASGLERALAAADEADHRQHSLHRIPYFHNHKAPAIGTVNPEQTPDRNGMVHLQRKPKIENLRASAKSFFESPRKRLHRKPKSGDLRAHAAADSAKAFQIRYQTPTIDIQTLDIMIQTLNIASPSIHSLKKQEGEVQHCGTLNCIAQIGMMGCDVCKEAFVPHGVGWLHWERAGNFCPSCIVKAFEEIAAEEDDYAEYDY